MDKAFQDTIVGVLAGVLTTALLFALRALWEAKVTPFLRELRYTGFDVSGTWKGAVPDLSLTLVLNQSAHALTGTYHVHNRVPGNEFDLVFDVTGRIWEGYVALNCTPADRKVNSYCTCLLKIGGGGGVLVGKVALRNVHTESVDAEPMLVFRDRLPPQAPPLPALPPEQPAGGTEVPVVSPT